MSKPRKEHDEIKVCKFCGEPPREISSAEVSYCDGCQSVEPDLMWAPCPCEDCEEERKAEALRCRVCKGSGEEGSRTCGACGGSGERGLRLVTTRDV